MIGSTPSSPPANSGSGNKDPRPHDETTTPPADPKEGAGGPARLRIKPSGRCRGSDAGAGGKDLEIELPGHPGGGNGNDNGTSPKRTLSSTSVAQLKALVRAALGGTPAGGRPPSMRLVCKGRLLSPDDRPLSDFAVSSGDVVHVVLAGTATANANANTSATASASVPQPQQHDRHRRRRQRPNRGIGTIVGPGGRVTRDRSRRAGEDDEEDDGGSSTDSDGDGDDDAYGPSHSLYQSVGSGSARSRRERRHRDRRGFDLLRGPLSRSEITALRTYFNRDVDRYVRQQQQQQQQQSQETQGDSSNGNGNGNGNDNSAAAPPTLHLDEPDLTRRRLLVEEEWMRVQGPTSEFRLNLNQSALLRFASLDGGTTGGNNSNGNHQRLRSILGLSDGNNSGSGSSNARSSSGRTTAFGQATTRSTARGSEGNFLWGFCLGYFTGIIGLVWVWMPAVPPRQKAGILAGICLQLVLETGDGVRNDGMDGSGGLRGYNDPSMEARSPPLSSLAADEPLGSGNGSGSGSGSGNGNDNPFRLRGSTGHY